MNGLVCISCLKEMVTKSPCDFLLIEVNLYKALENLPFLFFKSFFLIAVRKNPESILVLIEGKNPVTYEFNNCPVVIVIECYEQVLHEDVVLMRTADECGCSKHITCIDRVLPL